MPIVKLQFGTILKPDSIKEGDDIYFECIVEARPPALSIEWYLNVRSSSSYPTNNTLALNLLLLHTCAKTIRLHSKLTRDLNNKKMQQ